MLHPHLAESKKEGSIYEALRKVAPYGAWGPAGRQGAVARV